MKVNRRKAAWSHNCVAIGLAAGFAIQSVGRRIDRPGTVRGMVVALAALAAGLVMSILADASRSVVVTLLAAAVLGCGYGMALIGGLLEVQRIAGPDDLAGLTAVYYTLTYIGFAFPALLAWIAQTFPSLGYREFFGFGLVMIVVALALVLLGGRARPANP